jgi:hypothetical protein
MSNGYFLADTNSLVYAYRAGGAKLLDTYLDAAEEQDRKFAITETVRQEIKKGPLGEELLRYLSDRNVPVISAPQTEQQLASGMLSPKSAGEVSMLEVAAREEEAGRITRIWSDDKYFDSPQIMRGHPDVHRSMSAELLDEAYEQKFIGSRDYRAFRDGYEAQADFRPGESPRLNTFRHDLPSPEIDAPHRMGPAHMQAGRTLGVAGLALEIYDGADSLRTAQRLRGEGNATAAESELVHFGARSVGGWTGAGIGMAGGALLGVKTGPGLLVTGTIGGVAGVFAGDKFAEWTDNRRIYNQELGGNTWTYDPDKPSEGWLRRAPIDSSDDGIDNARRGDLRASPATENRLNYQATSASVELVLGGPPAQRNPFSLPAEAGDTPSSRTSNWVRDPESGAWQREVYGPFVERGMTPHHTETADPERAARLDRQAAAIVVENAANSPASIAARYEDTYIRNGWAAHGDMPAAVRNARTDVDTLIASDGKRYERQANGHWVGDGILLDTTANSRLHDELEATRAVLEARLPPPREIPPVPPMDAEARLRDAVAGAYRNAGVDVDDRQVAIAAAAVRATWDANGLDPATTALQVKPQADGRYGPDSRIASLRLEADGKTYAIAAVTSADEIRRAGLAPQPVPERAQEPVEPTAPASRQSRLSDPREPGHPDHRLYAQIEQGVHRIDADLGRSPDANSERLAMSAFAAAKSQQLTAADHIVINRQGTEHPAGAFVFVVQGQDPWDERNRVARIATQDALSQPVERSLQQVDTLRQDQAQTLAQAQNVEQQTQGQGEAVRSLRMG